MSDLVVLGLKLSFLALLWVFVISAISVVRTDLFGRKVPLPDAAGAASALTQPTGRRGRRKAAKAQQTPTTLRIVEGERQGTTVALDEGVLIGRSPEALDLYDPAMSGRHASIRLTADGVVIEDLGSTNGTFVNDYKINRPTLLRLGDVIRIGKSTLTLGA